MFEKKVTDKLRIEANQRIKERDYWLNKLSGQLVNTYFYYDHFITSTSIPTDEEKQGHRHQSPRRTEITEAFSFRLEEELSTSLVKLSNDADFRLHMILVAALTALLHKYTGHIDIITGTPIYKQEADIDFINTVLPLRICCHADMTFKSLLLQVRETVFEAVENQNYPIEMLVDKLDIKTTASYFPLFETAILVQNIHDKSYLQHIPLNITFSFLRTPEHIEGIIHYKPLLYQKQTITRISEHFRQFCSTALFNIDLKIARLNILSSPEKKRLLFEFNNNTADFPRNKFLCGFLEDHARQNPDRVAVSFMGQEVTYRQLNQRANSLATVLRESGIEPDQPVGILMDRSHHMVESILATWKAGAVYLPLGTEYPWERLGMILHDSEAGILLTRLVDVPPRLQEIYRGKIICLDKENIENKKNRETQSRESRAANADQEIHMNNLAYIIYTSGSTGNPKGAMVEHLGMMNHIQAKINDLHLTGKSIVAQNANHTFDISVWQFFSSIVPGGKIVIYPHELILDTEKFITRLSADRVTVLEVVPSYLSVMLDFLDWGSRTIFLFLDYLVVTGEELNPRLVEKWFDNYPAIKVVNAYGPTEASDDITHHIMDRSPDRDLPGGRLSIGKPLQNLNIYIVDPGMNLCPIGVRGEIWVSGVGVGRGYVNNPEKTHQVFHQDPFSEKKKKSRLYRTGDLGQWQTNGTIDFFGRKDHQVKIRGFRIELGEIESLLNQHPQVKQAIVTDKKDQWDNKYLCAYFIPRQANEDWSTALKNYLLDKLPDYMVPAHFVPLEQIPLTANGKVDRKTLPEPVENKKQISPPTNRLEKKVLELWAEALALDQKVIGIDDNFFQLGGHSLKAMLLIAKIHQELNIKIPLAKVFHFQTIRELAAFIEKTAPDEFISIEPGEKKEFYNLSPAQKRLYIFQQMNVASISYNMLQTYVLPENPNREKLAGTFKNLIERHESLRTSFHMVNQQSIQKIHDEVKFEIEYDEPGTGNAYSSAPTEFMRAFDLSRAPLLRVRLKGLAGERKILMVDMHHIICDGVSHEILLNDFNALYRDQDLPPLRLHYKDFSLWQSKEKQGARLKQQEAFWLKEFAGEIPVLNLPMDYSRPALESSRGALLIFELENEEVAKLNQLVLKEKTTVYFFLLAVFYVVLSRISSQEDIIVGTITVGRRHADLAKIIGMFVNTLVLRNYPTEDKIFREFLREVNDHTFFAFENQDYSFEDLLEKLGIKHDINRNPLFDVMFSHDNQDVQNRIHVPRNPGKEMLHRDIPTAPKFDMTWHAISAGDRLYFEVEYNKDLFHRQTVQGFIGYFQRILSHILEDPGQKISGFEIGTKEEKEKKLALLAENLEM